MRDMVEIGMGRVARRTYGLGEVSIVPARRTRSSKDVSTRWQIDAYGFDSPVVAHATDALCSPGFCIELGRQGGLGVLNGEGLFARHANAEELLDEIAAAARDALTPAETRAVVRKLQELHSAPIVEELLAVAVGEIRDAGVTAAVRVSPQHARDLTPMLIRAGVEILFVQGTLISAEHVSAGAEEPLNLKEFIGGLDVPVVAGGVVDHRTALHLMRSGAAGVIVGYGAAEYVTTTGETLGIDVPMATAIADAAAARRDYLDETGGRYVHVLADGGMRGSGDIARAIACGADGVVLGPLLAMSEEAAGGGVYWNSVAAHPQVPRGTILPGECEVGEDGRPIGRAPLATVLHGPSDDPDGQRNLVGALRRSMAKCGYSDLKSFQKVDLAVM